MATSKLWLVPYEGSPTFRILRVDDPRRQGRAWSWAYVLHDGSVIGAGMVGAECKLTCISAGGESRERVVPAAFAATASRPFHDGTRLLAIENKRTLLELDLATGDAKSIYSVERGDLDPALGSADYLGANALVVTLGKNLILLERGGDGRFAEIGSSAHAGFAAVSAEDRFVIVKHEKKLSFYARGPEKLSPLGSLPMRYGQVAEGKTADRRVLLVSADGDSWSTVEGLSEASEAKSTQKAKPRKPKAKTKEGPLDISLERKDSAPANRAEQLIGSTASGWRVSLDGPRVLAARDGSGPTELAVYEPGTQIYVASIHPAEDRLLIGAAPVFPSSLFEIEIPSGTSHELGLSTAQRAAFLGNDHVVVLHYQERRLSLHPRDVPLGPPVFELSTAAQSLCAHPRDGWLVLTGMAAAGETTNCQLFRLETGDPGARLVHLANLAPKSKRLKIYFVHELLVDADALTFRCGSDSYTLEKKKIDHG
jgi:hypothetical protein